MAEHKLFALLETLKQVGVLRTCKRVVAHISGLRFDHKYGLDSSWKSLNELEVFGDHKDEAEMYQPVHPIFLESVFQRLDIPKQGIFVDVGCGKGRALCVAAELGFTTVRGIEFSPELCQMARENIKKYIDKSGFNGVIDVFSEDATAYSYQGDESVYFMFNPFGESVMNIVIRKILKSCKDEPRPCWLIYLNPVQGRVIKGWSDFVPVFHGWAIGYEFTVYRVSQLQNS